MLLIFSIVCAEKRRVADGDHFHFCLHCRTVRPIGQNLRFLDIFQTVVLLQQRIEVAEASRLLVCIGLTRRSYPSTHRSPTSACFLHTGQDQDMYFWSMDESTLRSDLPYLFTARRSRSCALRYVARSKHCKWLQFRVRTGISMRRRP